MLEMNQEKSFSVSLFLNENNEQQLEKTLYKNRAFGDLGVIRSPVSL